MVTNHLRHQSTYTVRCLFQRPAGGRKDRTILDQFLDIVRCPVKFRYYQYLKFHGARTAFSRGIGGKMISAGYRTLPGRRSAGVCTHRTGTHFCSNLNRTIRTATVRVPYDDRPGTLWCPAGHRTMSDKRQEIIKISLQIGRYPSGHRTMPVRDRPMFYKSKLPSMRSDVFLQKYILHLHT